MALDEFHKRVSDREGLKDKTIRKATADLLDELDRLQEEYRAYSKFDRDLAIMTWYKIEDVEARLFYLFTLWTNYN